MKVVIYLADQNPHRDRTRGVTNFTDCLLSGLSCRTDMSLSTLVSASSYTFKAAGVETVRLPWRTDQPVTRLMTDNLSALIINAMKSDVVYYPKGYVSYLMRPRCPVVGTVHDTILQFYADRYPRFRSRVDFAYWIGLMKASLRRLDMILADSVSGQQQILEFCARYKITPPPIRVTYAASDYEDVDVRPGFKKDYVVHFASTAPHKKTRRLMELWSLVSSRKPDWPQLKLIGPGAAVEEFLGHPGVSPGACADRQALSKILQEARAVLLPSEIEGFGLPALEGYFNGTPVCYVKGTSVEELLKPFTDKGGFMLEDPASFEAAVDAVLGMSFEDVWQVRNSLRARFSRNNFVERVAQSWHDILRK